MHPDTRRIIAVEAHRRRTGHCPGMIHALGTGETFAIEPACHGFTDLETGSKIRIDANLILLPTTTIELRLHQDVSFAASDLVSGEIITGRAGGGSSVTLYDHDDYYQYAVVNEHGI
jgi:hypothetical protein